MQHIEPADERIISTLQEIWKRGFRQDTVGLDDDFFQLGGDSLLAAHLFAEMNSYFNVSLPIITLAQAPTIRKLASAVREQKMRSVARSVVPIRVSGSRPPLFCAHGQSGNLLMYHSLAQHMGGDQPLYGLQPRGIDQKQEPLNTIEEMASVYIDEIKQIQSKGSYFLLGYCMGGSIVIEMAQQLVSRGEKIGMLAVVDSYNVGVIQPGLCDRIIFKTQMYWFGLCHFFAIDRGRKIAFIRRRLNELRIPPSEVHHANTRAALSYHARPYPGQLLHVSPLHQFARYSNPDVCWDKMVGGVYSVSLPIYPGQMFEEPHVASLAKAITTALQRRTPGTNICA